MEFLKDYAEAIIALCALMLTTYQLVAIRRHNVISVRPNLADMSHQARNKTDSGVEFRFQFEVSNMGLGPAYIEEHIVLLNGKVCEPNAALKSVLDGIKYDSTVLSLGEGYAISPGTSKILLDLKINAHDQDAVDRYIGKLEQLDMVIKYKSAYGERFTLRTKDSA